MKNFHEIMTALQSPTVFYFVRHGESEGNAAGKMQGHRDHVLTDLGRRQARTTGRWFADEGIAMDRVFSSPLSRAMETARIITEAAEYASPLPLETAKELDTGMFTGLSLDDIKERHPEEYAEFIVGSWEAVRDAESVASLTGRALATWEAVVEHANTVARDRSRNSESSGIDEAASPIRVMVVTHGGMLQWIFKTSFGAMPDAPIPWMPLILATNCAVSEFSARPVSSVGKTGEALSWYYGQWSRLNATPAEASSVGSRAAEQFHTGGDQVR